MKFLRRVLVLGLLALIAFFAGNLIIVFFGKVDNFTPSNRSTNHFESASEKARNLTHIKAISAELAGQPGYVNLADIPLPLRQAVIAVEDRKFYDHPGIDLEGILRATLVNIQNGEISEGGSTITQQLARTLFLSNEQSFTRKAWEAGFAVSIETQLGKDKILELYLNTIYFGENTYGVAAAAKKYYHKNLQDLNLREMTTLAGIPNGPSIYNPIVDPQASKRRQQIVIAAMLKNGFIGQEEADNIAGK
ncbi:MAG: biosynthetic peptidoglycan transglycosylase [Bacillota bacterium]